jgi:hypothetical protein
MKSIRSHLVDAQFRGAAKAVLDGPDDAEKVMTVALKLEHSVHHVLQDLGACYAPILGDMTHENDRGTRLFCKRTNSPVHSLICDTLPGVESISSEYTV